MGIGQMIKKHRMALNLTQNELAEKLGVSQQSVTGWENNASVPRESAVRSMMNLFNVSRNELFGEPEAHSTTGKNIPILGTVVAGQPAYAAENIVGWEEVTAKMSLQGKLFALRVKGASMEPDFKEGDIVIVREQPDIESGDIAVVLINGDEATLKKVKKDPNGLFLYAFNQAVYEPHFYSNNDIETLPVRIVGRVIENRRSW
ncbi:MAG: helix-turn-helix domain-containing protein [Acidaminococcus intestini]|uniref:Helix-turn-helix domain-containing protein n=1 Tax=Acidaminococcus intestini TaxID=187327 RepID=A0A943EL16_9FIRM|nr:helix-turn-helix domain-containing protein [Acidaminococcus intestini]